MNTPISGPAQRPMPIPRFEYCQVGYRHPNAMFYVDILFYDHERGVATHSYEPFPAVIAALGLAGWRLVGFDTSGDMWFLRPWIPGRPIDDVQIVAPESVRYENQGKRRTRKKPQSPATSEES